MISCEFFPAKTPAGARSLLEKTIPRLKAARPDFCSVTYGAGGSTRDSTLDIVENIQGEHGLPAMAHLTCVGSTSADIGGFLDDARARGIKNILALRGDPPEGQAEFIKQDGGFEFSFQLVEAVHAHGGFSIGTAGFPEGHIACTEGREVDWQRLKDKGVRVGPILNHDESPAQVSPTVHPGVYVRSFYFLDPDGITLEFACWTKQFGDADTTTEPKTAADRRASTRV